MLRMRTELPPDRPRLNVLLSDGSNALLSPLILSDREWLEQGFSELSEESRFSRFGVGLAGLSSGDLDYLADVDLHQHVAFGASIEGEGAGVGRYIVFIERGCAEVAITVLDRFQRRGLAKALLSALIAVARHDGIEELCFEVVPGNAAMRAMLDVLNAVTSEVDGLVEGRLLVPEIPPRPYESGVVSMIEEMRS